MHEKLQESPERPPAFPVPVWSFHDPRLKTQGAAVWFGVSWGRRNAARVCHISLQVGSWSSGNSWSSGCRDRTEMGSLVLCLPSVGHRASSKVTFMPVFYKPRKGHLSRSCGRLVLDESLQSKYIFNSVVPCKANKWKLLI